MVILSNITKLTKLNFNTPFEFKTMSAHNTLTVEIPNPKKSKNKK